MRILLTKDRDKRIRAYLLKGKCIIRYYWCLNNRVKSLRLMLPVADFTDYMKTYHETLIKELTCKDPGKEIKKEYLKAAL